MRSNNQANLLLENEGAPSVRKFIFALFCVALCPIAFAQQALNNDAIVRMVKAGLSDEVVVATIDASPGQYATTANDLIALKQAGVSDKVIGAVVARAMSPASNAAPAAGPTAAPPVQSAPQPIQATPPTASTQTPATPTTLPPNSVAPQPRVYLESASKGPNRNAARDQSMEMSKDFESDCPGVKITINQQMADYTVLLNHIEAGLLVRDNQIQIADRDGDLISRTKEGGSIRGDVKKACAIILGDWNKPK
jgi:hypothetical protein